MSPAPRFVLKAPRPGAFLLGCAIIAFLPLAAAAGAGTVRVAEVLDGDSVRLADRREVRLIGINAPERGYDNRPDEPLANAARERLRELTRGQTLRLETETEPRDRYNRVLAHLFLPDGQLVQEILVREGLASSIAIPPNLRELARLRAAEAEARRAGRGLWGHAFFEPVSADRLQPAHTGFRFVQGTVTRIGRSKKYVYLDLGRQFALRIRHDDWAKYFDEQPQAWQGVRVVARGWVTLQDDRHYMNIGHPAMLERLTGGARP